MGLGRPVEKEMENIRNEEKQKEKQEEQKEQQEPRENQQQMVEIPGNPQKSAAKHQGAGGKRKKSQPDQSQMSQTSEFKGKLN
jgi:hypothetical protein